MTIYEKLCQSESFRIDLNKKNLWIDGVQYIKSGINITHIPLIKESYDLEELYQQYKYSVPSSKTCKSYFKALPVDRLTDYQLAAGMPRFKAQALLEGYILLAGMAGLLEIDFAQKWYWQSKIDADFVILKEWIQKK